MTQRVSESLVAVLIRIGLLLALAIMLMAENAQAQPLHVKPLSLSFLAGSVDAGQVIPQACTFGHVLEALEQAGRRDECFAPHPVV